MSTANPAPPQVVLDDVIDRRKVGRFHLLVLALTGSVMFLDGLDTQVIAFIAPVVAREWGLPVAALGPIFSASIVGLMIGYLALSPLANRFGQRNVVLASTAMIGVFSIASAFAADDVQLILLRLATGIGLGGAIPSTIAIVSEYAPARRRSSFVMGIYACYAFGFVVASLLSGPITRAIGWRGMFVLCGVLPLIAVIALALLLPESPSRLLRSEATIRFAQVCRRVAPEVDPGTVVLGPEGRAARAVSARSVLTELLQRRWIARTLLLWLAFIVNLGVFYAVLSWLPTIAVQSGTSAGVAAGGTALLMVGGIIAAAIIGPAMDRRGPFTVLAIVYLLGSVLLLGFALAFSAGSSAFLISAFLVGTCVAGGQMSVIALSAQLYPNLIRSTGVGWALGVGRIGGIVAPLVVGLAIGVGVSAQTVFTVMGLAMAVAGVAVVLLGRAHRRALAP
ncbi:MFS transporter [Actinomycetospora sp. NBRC 106378]|uniref:MFS transporter n=1 Tax=Actinomycetospora sp. NBRC 106378 TaxID=3032208 RepID=UPI0024A200DC|nr:MFS transporter [Actinomycetospora sp. NBRC 106378]GLZ50638.1 MFS transporter [Actinomycetospora sp. NBRC 106378]